MHEWIAQTQHLLSAGQAMVLVTLAKAEGSTPREPGARMLVTADGQWLTIGGGHMEWCAIRIARDMLAVAPNAPASRIERMPLGPRLGQCCGGAATLVFERLTPSDLAWLLPLQQGLQTGHTCQRTVLLPTGHDLAVDVPPVRVKSMPQNAATRDADAVSLTDQPDGGVRLTEILAPPGLHIVLFGAGHVGQALIPILGTLPCSVLWVDERDAQFPDQWPDNVQVEATDIPEAVIDLAPPQSYFLVMTHNHALDQRLCRQLLRRDDFAYFGLIGSRTKRRKFERRLKERGVSDDRLARMVCPIGVPGIHDKSPAVIAVAVAAQLLQVHEQAAATAAAQAYPHALLPLPLNASIVDATTE